MSDRRRAPVRVVGVLATLAVLALPAAPATPSPTAPESIRPAARIDPALGGQIATLGVAPAVLTWDRTETSREAVATYLREQGIEAQMLSHLSVAFACAGSAQDLGVIASAPGAVSVWGDHPLTPALDRSVRTAFGGDPNAVWEGLGVTGKGVAVAVVDTGIDGTHPDLQYGSKTKVNVRALFGNHDTLGPYNDPCVQNQYSPQMDDTEVSSGHGTHLAGVAAGDGTVSGGRYRGVAPGADLIGIAIADTVTPQAVIDQFNQLSLLNAIAGMNYVLATGLEGCKAGNWIDDQTTCPQFTPLLAKVVLAGWTQDGLHDPWHPMTFIVRDFGWYGITVVFPAGNEGSAPSDCSAAETCHYNPFAIAPAIGVAATPKRSKTTLEPYSSRGDPVVRMARNQPVRYEPMLAAPGTGVVAARRPGVAPYAQPPGSILGGGPASIKETGADRRYVALTGTSVAAAHVAGAIALMQHAAVKGGGCFLTAQQVLDILRSTADPMPGYASWEVGFGAIDVAGAVNASRGGGPFSPDPWMCPPPA